MPIYMDVHIVAGAKAKDVAEAHTKDLQIQDQHKCKCMTYWFDEVRESVFCLIQAPTKESVVELHNHSHGLIPHKVIEVNSSLVEAFLGRLFDPADATTNNEGLKVFTDPSYRILLVTKIIDPVLLKFRLGEAAAAELLARHHAIIRNNLAQYDGREVEQEGSGFIISFTSAIKAVNCALAIEKELSVADADALGFRLSINSGEPIEGGNSLFENTIQLAQHICTVAKYFKVALSSSVKALIAKDHQQGKQQQFLTLTPQDEAFLKALYQTLEANWQNPHFDVEDHSQVMAISKSQLYRKTIALTGLSPNQLLKEYRLEKAKELMKKQFYNIAQITYDAGFTSPSYFTKCFKKKYGLLPMHYMELLKKAAVA